MDTLELNRPHGFLLWRGKKSAVLSPADLPVGQEMEVATAGERFGVAVLGQPARMLASEADRKEYFESHRVWPREREAWWPDAARFNVYPVERFEPYSKIQKDAGPRWEPAAEGCPECLNEGGGWCRLHETVAPEGMKCADFELVEDWRGAKEDEVPYEKYEENGEWCVRKADTKEVLHCYPTEGEADRYLAALRINVEAAEKADEKDKPAMVECPKCGKFYPEGTEECPHCGAEVGEKSIEGLAKHLAKKHPDGEGFFTACMADESVQGYDEEVRAAVCAKAHKIALGKWPAEKLKDEKGLVKQMELKDEEITRLAARIAELESKELLDARANAVRSAFNAMFNRVPGAPTPDMWARDVDDEGFVIVESMGKTYKVSYRETPDGYEFAPVTKWQEIEMIWRDKAAKFDESEWSGDAAQWDSAEAYCKDCLLDFNDGGEKVKGLCKLPYRKPGSGKPNKAALRAIAGGARGINAVEKPEGVSDEAFRSQVAAAKRRLRGWWPDAFDKEPPDSLKARGEGRGDGGEPQGDGGADVCVCPKCGAESPHEKGDPCTGQKCPKCGASMTGSSDGKVKGQKEPKGAAAVAPDSEKAGRRLRKPMLQRLKDAYETLKEVLGWAQYEDEEPQLLSLFKGDSGFATVKSASGDPWVVTWTTNAFRDRDDEIFSTEGLERYVAEAEKSGNRGRYNLWHVPGTEFAEVKAQAVVGRFLVEAGPYLGTEVGRAAKRFFMEFPDGHPVHAPEGWGCSPEFRYLPEERRKGVFETFWITDRAVLPRLAAANVRTRGGVAMAMTDKQRALFEEALGEEQVERLVEEAEGETRKHEEAGVAFKEATPEDDMAEKKVDLVKVAEKLKALAGQAEGDLKAALTEIAGLLDGSEEEPKEEEKEIDLEVLAAEIAKHFDVQLEPLGEMAASQKALADEVQAMKAELAAVRRDEDKRKQHEIPRFTLSLERKASEAAETALEGDDELLKAKPREAAGKSPASHFFGG
ncbi:MAG: zinc ribbon domain-containing protein, partial [Acidobacteriota bacterium]